MNWTTIAIELGIIIGLATIICGLMFAVTIPFVTSIQAKSVLSIAAIIIVTLIYFSVQLDWISNPLVIISLFVLCVVTGAVTSVLDEKKQKRAVVVEDESWRAEG
ncbi:hypothetical protein [uncultured Exiguobacterium sp.]|uniref:hypothetical protein n=1 Tax=uncultured Exiguobacterium sp. TaxID=202669 RepID=UPI0025D34E2F|nr:hypothetical protein [uncultured Exiguobacterium sp.]